MRHVIVGASVLLAGSLVSLGVADVAVADTDGHRAGPLETVCVAIPDATAGDVAIVNTTVVDPSGAGYATAHNEVSNPTWRSSVNFAPNATTPNLTLTVVTAELEVCVTPSWSTTSHFVMDLVGLVDGSAMTASEGGAARLLDTRLGAAPVAPGATVCVGVPGTADAQEPTIAIVNTTVTEPETASFITVHADRDHVPATSSVNFAAGQTVANLAFQPLSAAGTLCATAADHGSVHVLFDLIGTLDADAFARPDNGSRRILDTRLVDGPTAGQAVAEGGRVCVEVPDAHPGDVVMMNVAVTEPQGLGFATVHADGAVADATSTHNFAVGQTVANLTATELGVDRRICATPSVTATAHFVFDYLGAIDGAVFSGPPNGALRILDTRELDELPARLGDPDLVFGLSCDELLVGYQDAAIAELEQWGTVGQTELPSTGGDTDAPAGGTAEFSNTNTQFADVDEGDVVETDGTVVYESGSVFDQAANAHLVQINVVDVASRSLLSTFTLYDRSNASMILYGDRLVVATHSTIGTATFVDLFDVSNPAAIQLVRPSTMLDGHLQAMRSVSGKVRLVLVSQRWLWDLFVTVQVDERHAAIRDTTIDDWLPHRMQFADDWAITPAQRAVDCEQIGVPRIMQPGSTTYVAEIDASSDGAVIGAVGVASSTYSVTASADHLFLSSYRAHQQFGWFGFDGGTISELHMFDLSPSAPAAYRGSAEVPGSLLNQFAIGEHDGVVRVAVTNGWWGPGTSSAVFALRITANGLERISGVADLGVGERIFAVRHVGPISYVVTFRQTDPLYVVDFTNPDLPVLQGELKIPGFSAYLHPAEGGMLIGVGQDANEFGVAEGAQISLFDVSVPSNPRRVDTVDFGSGTHIEGDHHAFLYWQPTGTIAVPVYGVGASRIDFVRVSGGDLTKIASVPFDEACDYPRRTIALGEQFVLVGKARMVFVDADSFAVTKEVTLRSFDSWCW
ncbi:MAG TPA: beta-propeller domain-containing protein [Ilumatobacter sp.]|nr:beta-propeller domain-containing protein [Ilumatobacter sp.]